MPRVVVTGDTAPRSAAVAGFADAPLAELPASATVVDSAALRDAGARRLADLTQFDASVTDAYNAPGYLDFLTIRGFVLDNRFNYRREGLPISAETPIPLENKERIEILKGTSGIQAGTSAPGGLVHYVVKRPGDRDIRTVRLEATERASLLGTADLGGRFGTDRTLGWRLNLVQERMRPELRNLDGERSLAAFAGDWRAGRDTLVEAEVEWSRKSQPSQQAFSILGSRLPAPPDPQINLNNQAWSQPSVFDALTGTLRMTQALARDWRWTAQLGTQTLRTDDRLAYAFGCGAEGNYDRFCSDGSYDAYDFRSERESRRQQAARLELAGKLQAGGIGHDVGASLQWSRVRNRFQGEAFNYVGSGNVQGTAAVPADPALTGASTNRDERAVELGLHDVLRWNERFSTWFGLRHTRLERASVRTDGSRPTGYDAGFTTPWLAASYAWQPGQTVYASYGEGAESQVVPNRAGYINAGIALPVLQSRQLELGVRGGTDALGWNVAWFRIARPVSNIDTCVQPCTAGFDGEQLHQGIEGSLQGRHGGFSWEAGAMWLDAERRGSADQALLNGQRPTNVPEWTARARATWQVPGVAGLTARGALVYEGSRRVLPDGSITLPAWTRIDAGLRYASRIAGAQAVWSLAVDNLADRRYWKESPYQFGHVYLYNGAPRTLRAGIELTL